jgi:hypothetical protein
MKTISAIRAVLPIGREKAKRPSAYRTVYRGFIVNSKTPRSLKFDSIFRRMLGAKGGGKGAVAMRSPRCDGRRARRARSRNTRNVDLATRAPCAPQVVRAGTHLDAKLIDDRRAAVLAGARRLLDGAGSVRGRDLRRRARASTRRNSDAQAAGAACPAVAAQLRLQRARRRRIGRRSVGATEARLRAALLSACRGIGAQPAAGAAGVGRVRDARATPTLPPGCFLLLISPPPRFLPHGEEPRPARRLEPRNVKLRCRCSGAVRHAHAAQASGGRASRDYHGTAVHCGEKGARSGHVGILVLVSSD